VKIIDNFILKELKRMIEENKNAPSGLYLISFRDLFVFFLVYLKYCLWFK